MMTTILVTPIQIIIIIIIIIAPTIMTIVDDGKVYEFKTVKTPPQQSPHRVNPKIPIHREL